MTKTAKQNGFPKEFPAWGEDERIRTYSPQCIGSGSRMKVFKSADGQTVLRVPLHTEQQLIERTGKSGILASYEDPLSEISNDTIRDIHHYKIAKGFVGRNTVGVIPMHFPDREGNWRTYSVQRYVDKRMDMTDLWLQVDELSETVKKRIRRMIEDIKELVAETGLILDLNGHGNVVLDDQGFPRIIDVNMIQRLLPDDEILLPQYRGEAKKSEVIAAARTGYNQELRTMLAPEYLSLSGYPIADWSIQRLQRWETYLGMQTHESVLKDEIYSKYIHPTRDEVLRRIESEVRSLC
jgi:hypothetical protein